MELLHPSVFAEVPGLVAACTTRQGGVSAPPFDALNLGWSVGDAPEAVAENRRRVGEAVGVPPRRWATADQVHGASVATVEAPGPQPATDGLVTDVPGLLLAIGVADCAPVLLADADAGVIGACHAGWRGTVGGVVPNTVAAMQDLGARPGRMRAYVGPCIGPESFEVGPEVAAQFDDAFVLHPPGAEKPHVDLKAAIRAQLTAAGLPEASVEASPHDTMAEADRFFSYRAANGRTGRMLGVIVRVA
jgi:hypothetical protein